MQISTSNHHNHTNTKVNNQPKFQQTNQNTTNKTTGAHLNNNTQQTSFKPTLK